MRKCILKVGKFCVYEQGWRKGAKSVCSQYCQHINWWKGQFIDNCTWVSELRGVPRRVWHSLEALARELLFLLLEPAEGPAKNNKKNRKLFC